MKFELVTAGAECEVQRILDLKLEALDSHPFLSLLVWSRVDHLISLNLSFFICLKKTQNH